MVDYICRCFSSTFISYTSFCTVLHTLYHVFHTFVTWVFVLCFVMNIPMTNAYMVVILCLDLLNNTSVTFFLWHDSNVNLLFFVSIYVLNNHDKMLLMAPLMNIIVWRLKLYLNHQCFSFSNVSISLATRWKDGFQNCILFSVENDITMSNQVDLSRDCSHTYSYHIKTIPIRMKRTTALTFDGGSLIHRQNVHIVNCIRFSIGGQVWKVKTRYKLYNDTLVCVRVCSRAKWDLMNLSIMRSVTKKVLGVYRKRTTFPNLLLPCFTVIP